MFEIFELLSQSLRISGGLGGGECEWYCVVDSHIGDQHFLVVIHAGNGGLSLGHNVVVVNVVGQQALVYSVRDGGDDAGGCGCGRNMVGRG